MRRTLLIIAAAALAAAALLAPGAQNAAARQERLARLRILGKALYENPTTQNEAVEQFRLALELNPSTRERLNYGLALLRAGRTEAGVRELEAVQKQDPALPHTWFNLGIVYRKNGEFDKATVQFERMVQLQPNEPVSHYNLGVLYKLAGKLEQASAEFLTASRLDPNLAAPHFQLFNTYRQASRKDDAQKELATFQVVKKQQEGSATPEDMEWCDYAEIYDPPEPHAPAAPAAAEPGFDDRKLEAQVDPATAGLAVVDLDGDGRPDLVAWSRRGILALRNGVTPVAQPALAGLDHVISIAPADFDNDGLTDLAVLTESGAALFRNQKGKWVPGPAGLPRGRFEKAVWIDYDHDYDLDLVLLGGEKSTVVRNQGAAGFAEQPAALPWAAGHAIDASVFRAVADTKGIDLLVSYADHPGVLYRDRLAGKFESVPEPLVPAGARGLVAEDLDNDGQLDLAFQAPGGITWLRNQSGSFERGGLAPGAAAGFALADLDNRGVLDLVTSAGVLLNRGRGEFAPARPNGPGAGATAWAAGDFDNSGRVSLVYVAPDGALHLLTPKLPAKNHWIGVKLEGVKNPLLSPGAEVEIKTGFVYRKQTYTGLPLHFGMGLETQADTVRITWANGMIQNEMHQPAGSTHLYKEAQRMSGSCPMIWTWNGREFEFLTDVLGVAPLGASSGDGKYFPVDHDEYVQIPGRALFPRHGRYEIRMTEELSEVSYLDQVQLIAVDHPAAVDIFTNDKFKSPPFPEFRLFGVGERRYPRRARDEAGRDVRDRLLARDRRYVDTFERNFAGVARMHALELDFGAGAAPANRAVLVLNGWVDWADGSTFLSAAQEGAAQQGAAGLVMPYLQVRDAQGRWRTVIEDMGMPSGKPKTIAVDLTGKFLSASREVRIVTNLCVFWDEIFLGEDPAPPPARLTRLEALAADLHFRGFSRCRIHPERKQPEWFSYPEPSPVSPWNPTPGRYTRYGPVTELVARPDDRLLIMGSGDELRLEYDATRLPALPTGWARDFLLLVDGWAKDRDANTAFSQTVEPLPFQGMSSYPYPPSEHYPDTPELRRYRELYNTRPALRLIRPLSASGAAAGE